MTACRSCGCTETNACPGGCYWAKPGLCSACIEAQEAELVETAMDWARATALHEHTLSLCGREYRVENDPDFLIVRDHLWLPIFTVDAGGYSLMPHYDAAELVPLFEGERA